MRRTCEQLAKGLCTPECCIRFLFCRKPVLLSRAAQPLLALRTATRPGVNGERRQAPMAVWAFLLQRLKMAKADCDEAYGPQQGLVYDFPGAPPLGVTSLTPNPSMGKHTLPGENIIEKVTALGIANSCVELPFRAPRSSYWKLLRSHLLHALVRENRESPLYFVS